jgi:hypothetical protein
MFDTHLFGFLRNLKDAIICFKLLVREVPATPLDSD